ncbi:hypothetical protein PHMEG_0004520 [Phytophthora megakarya]|uniref:Ndc10 domain-containing protein n=1 Tax=Phytophthora megakarya TaxID=4795 RepID=A0A225WVB6_9STRA|nr:hypothetical protein PHMEG_0004520 [Phytophthora megakarya]
MGGSTVCGYVNAIVDLYNQQVALRVNSNDYPRSPQTVITLKCISKQICDTFLELDDLCGRAAFLISRYGLLRGENVRDLELADMFFQPLDKEEFQPCIALVLFIQHGKMNTYGKLQHCGFMRNKNAHLCPVGCVAFYLFERFHIDLEPFPSFKSSREWYDIKFLRGKNRTKSISYETHKTAYEAVFSRLGLTFNKKTSTDNKESGSLKVPMLIFLKQDGTDGGGWIRSKPCIQHLWLAKKSGDTLWPSFQGPSVLSGTSSNRSS